MCPHLPGVDRRKREIVYQDRTPYDNMTGLPGEHPFRTWKTQEEE